MGVFLLLTEATQLFGSRRDENSTAMFGELAVEPNRELVANPNEHKRVRGEAESRPIHQIQNNALERCFIILCL